MTRTLLVRNKQPQHSLPGIADKQTSSAKKYGANAPQLHPIRCSIDFCVMLCNEQAKKQKLWRKRATVAPYSRRNRRHSKGGSGGVERWGPSSFRLA